MPITTAKYTRNGRVWCLSGGRRIADEVTQVVIQNVVGVDDALFADAQAQTWRWVGS
jgi:hypothetical protein